MSEMIGSRVPPILWKPWIFTGWGREAQASRWKSLRDGLEGHYREPEGQSQQTSHSTSQGMASQPNIGFGVHFSHIGIKIDGSLVIPVLIVHGFDDTSQIRCVRRILTITDLSPQVRTSLTATTAEKKVIIILVIRSGTCTIEKRW